MEQKFKEQAITIRQPATANLLLDSLDRDLTRYPSPFRFSINKNQALFNGFFNRIATTEVVLEWGEPNIVEPQTTTGFSYNGSAVYQWQAPTGFYTTQELFETLVADLNTQFGAGTFTLTNTTPGYYVVAVPANTFIVSDPLNTEFWRKLKVPAADIGVAINAWTASDVDLRLYRYIDFVSPQLTYNQDLKDNSSQTKNRDVLCRWYMAYDNPTPTDGAGFPIYMGMEPFVIRRLFNPPKYIRWDPIQPLGNLSFELYDENGDLIDFIESGDFVSNWLMTLQVSEN